MAPAVSLLLLALAGGIVEVEAVGNFTVYSAPVRLRYGQVFNKHQDPLPLPADIVSRYADGKKLLALTGFDIDMVRVGADGRETPVKLNDHYLHHYALYIGQNKTMQEMFALAERDAAFRRMLSGCHGMTGAGVHTFVDDLEWAARQRSNATPSKRNRLAMFGSASGAEFRHNPQRFEEPFGIVVEKPQVWSPLVHIINTNRPTKHIREQSWSPLLECPCTPQRRINVSAGTIDGRPPNPPLRCGADFDGGRNPSCHLSTYQGGWRCCEHGVFVVDTDVECSDPTCSEEPLDEVFLRFVFFYDDVAPSTRAIESAACCDVTGSGQGFQNIEYDVPACAEGTPSEACVHVVESVNPLGYFGAHPRSPRSPHKGSDLVDLVFASPHLHTAGVSIALMDAVSNRTICEVRRSEDDSKGVVYGHGDAPGDERDYLVGLEPCRWGGETAPPRFSRDHPMRTRAVYDASQRHTGVMSLWLMSVSPAGDPDLLV